MTPSDWEVASKTTFAATDARGGVRTGQVKPQKIREHGR